VVHGSTVTFYGMTQKEGQNKTGAIFAVQVTDHGPAPGNR
jgi:hypothetical protein